MGNVMISLDDEHEALLRRLAREKHSGKKGSLSNVVSQALDKEREPSPSIADFLDFLRRGVKGKYKMYSKRDELYD
jgi:hypothetical protein